MSNSDHSPAEGIAEAVRSGHTDPVALIHATLDTIDDLDRGIGAFQHVCRADALAAAEALRDHPDLSRLPLAGVPVGVKDSIDVIGSPTREGTRATSPQAATTETDAIGRLRAAGAIIVGKTTTPEMCLSGVTHSELSGITRNPWRLDRTPGGSSGGSAAAVAAGMVPVAIGTDGGGSVRIPAACCNLVGFKSARGDYETVGYEDGWYGVTQWGPLTTTVADAATVHDVLAGTDLRSTLDHDGAPLRIGHTERTAPLVRVEPRVSQIVARSLDDLASLGHKLTDTTTSSSATDTVSALRRAAAGMHRDAVEGTITASQLSLIPRLLLGVGSTLDRLGAPDEAALDAVAARMASMFTDIDVLATPTMAITPPAADLGRDNGRARLLWKQRGFTEFTSIWNLAGFPALSVPVGFTDDGLPVGMHLVAPPGQAQRVLQLASELESLRPWPRTASRGDRALAN